MPAGPKGGTGFVKLGLPKARSLGYQGREEYYGIRGSIFFTGAERKGYLFSKIRFSG
jgi:hypothetical protein